MAESIVQINEGAGKKLHTFNRTIGSNSVEDEVMLQGLPYLASYAAISTAALVTTTNDHISQLMAGGTLNVYVTRIYATQVTSAGAAAISGFELMRLTTAGTGGTAVTPSAVDTSDAASGAAAMTRPTVFGAVGTRIWRKSTIVRTGTPTTVELPAFDERWGPPQMTKPIRIAAGTNNGLVIRVTTGVATATYDIGWEFFEANF